MNNVVSSILGSTFFKLASALISFISVPLLLKTLGTNEYAVWVTMTALVAWLNLFDFGSGYSLKNKITEATAKNELVMLQTLIAGTIQFYLMMTVLIFLFFLFSLVFINVFKTHLSLALLIYLPIIFSFPCTLGHFLMQGLKKFNIFNFILLSQSVVWLIIIFLFNQNYFPANIYNLVICYSSLFVVANSLIIFIALRSLDFDWNLLFKFKSFKSSKGSILVGTKFFLLQVSTLFLYSLGNIMTYNHLKLANVAQYDTVNKVFLMGMTIFNVVISVYWTEISHEKALGNKQKLLKLYYQLMLLSTIFSVGSLLVTFIAPTAIRYWTRDLIHVSISQVYPFVILVTIQAFAYAGSVFLNAFEQLKGQIILSFFAAILIIPLANFLFALNFGIVTVPLAAAILTFPTLIYVLIKAYVTIRNLI